MAKLSNNPVIGFLRLVLGAALIFLALELLKDGHDFGGTLVYLLGLVVALPGALNIVTKMVGVATLAIVTFLAFSALNWTGENAGKTIKLTYWEWLDDNWLYALIAIIIYIVIGYIWGPEPGEHRKL